MPPTVQSVGTGADVRKARCNAGFVRLTWKSTKINIEMNKVGNGNHLSFLSLHCCHVCVLAELVKEKPHSNMVARVSNFLNRLHCPSRVSALWNTCSWAQVYKFDRDLSSGISSSVHRVRVCSACVLDKPNSCTVRHENKTQLSQSKHRYICTLHAHIWRYYSVNGKVRHPFSRLVFILATGFLGCNNLHDSYVKVKGKVVTVLLTQHHSTKAYWGSEDIAPRILWPRHLEVNVRLHIPAALTPGKETQVPIG
jgi:hypothetical protein